MPDSIEHLIPDAATTLVVLPLALAVGMLGAAFVGWLRVRRGVRVPYTRKTYHFLILTIATLVHVAWGAGGVVVYGSVIAVLVIGAVLRGDGFPFYEALARPTDAPHRSLFVMVPLATTALGGLLANLLFPSWAHVAYMAVAWGDAVGEPVGTRWGRHRFNVPSLGGVPAQRSLEGSAAVLVASAVACGITIRLAGVHMPTVAGAALAIGVVTAVVEALSHHGLDNLTIQVAAAGAAVALLG